MASTGVESQSPAAAAGKSQITEVRVYPHSPILYWWVVWAYGFFCALLTYAQGETFTIGGGKPLLIYPGACSASRSRCFCCSWRSPPR